MHIELDRLSAAIAGGVVVLAALALGARAWGTAAGEAVTYGDRARTFSAMATIERDLRNLGALAPAGPAPFVSWTTTGAVTTAAFYTLDADGNPAVVSYEPVPADTVDVGGQPTVVYSLRRTVGGAGTDMRGALFTVLTLTPVDASGTDLAAPFAGAAGVRVAAESRPRSGPLDARRDDRIVWAPNLTL